MFCSNCCTSCVSAGSGLAVPQEAQSSAFSNFSTCGFEPGATSAPAAYGAPGEPMPGVQKLAGGGGSA